MSNDQGRSYNLNDLKPHYIDLTLDLGVVLSLEGSNDQASNTTGRGCGNVCVYVCVCVCVVMCSGSVKREKVTYCNTH